MSTWALYDTLIQKIKQNDQIERVYFGESWVAVYMQSQRMGVAAMPVEQKNTHDPKTYEGKMLFDVLPLLKSWDLVEASLALACLNSQVNQEALIKSDPNPDAFLRFKDILKHKNVAVIGHFQYLETRIENICNLHVLEKRPVGNDYPDQACEYLLPSMDVVFITGSALSNKTLPRLLELCKNAYTILSGPSTPMVQELFSYGVDALCSFCVNDVEKMHIALNNGIKIFDAGRMVCVTKDNYEGKLL